MSEYTIQTTNMLKDATHGLTNLADGDVIVTQGYYTVNDGGAGTFVVCATNETANNVFTYALGANLIAKLQTLNGVVNVDQLGAKGDAIIPSTYYDVVSSKEECNLRTQATLEANNSNSGGFSATDNQSIFHVACTQENIKEVCLTTGKIYGVRSTFGISTSHVLNGCGAIIMNVNPTDTFVMIACSGNESSFKDSIVIKNIRLIGNYSFPSNTSQSEDPDELNQEAIHNSQGIWIRYGRNVHICNVQLERFGFGIHTTMNNALLYNQVSIDQVQMSDMLIGIQFNDVENSSITNCTISCDYTQFFGNIRNSRNHCIYAGGKGKNNVLNNLILANANAGSAINLSDASESHAVHSGLRIKNIIIDNCTRGIRIGYSVHNAQITHVSGTNIQMYGFELVCGKDILISDSQIEMSSTSEGALFVSSSSTEFDYLQTIRINHCSFAADNNLIKTGENRYRVGDDIFISNSCFIARKAGLNETDVPAFIQGTVSKVLFQKCIFKITGFKLLGDQTVLKGQETYTVTNPNSKNGTFFVFSSRDYKIRNEYYPRSPLYWVFDDCIFLNCTDTSINSPVLSSRASDEKNVVYCGIKNCLLIGFRWTIRISTTYEVQSNTHWNPCYYQEGEGINAISKQEAAAQMTAMGRFYATCNTGIIIPNNNLNSSVFEFFLPIGT